MESATLEMPKGLTPRFEIGALSALDVTASGETNAIRRADESLIRQLISVVDKILLEALNCQSASEFAEVRAKLWENYVRANRALTDTIKLLIPKEALEMLCATAEEQIGEDLARNRDTLFGKEIADQAEFSMWLFHRMVALAHEIAATSLSDKDADADLKLHTDFRIFSMWGRFHYDCVLAAMKFSRPISAEIQPAICEGMRAWVNASAIMEEALELRRPPVGESPEVELPWDEEDQELLDSSMRDLDAADSTSDDL